MAEPSDSASAPVGPSAPDAATSASTIMATASSAGTCSQILTTVHPSAWHMDVVSRSRRTFRLSFASQYSRLVRGTRECSGQACQKHPSTNTATLRRVNTMSARLRLLGHGAKSTRYR